MSNKEEKVLSITKEDGTLEDVQLLMCLTFNDTKKEYVVYTKNELDENANVTVYVLGVDREDDVKLVAVESDLEWTRIKDVLRELSKNELDRDNMLEITQSNLKSATVNDIGDARKVKLRSVSLANSISNIKNIPLLDKEKEEVNPVNTVEENKEVVEQEEIKNIELLANFKFNDNNNEYIIYTKNEKDINDNITVYISSVSKKEDTIELDSVEDEIAWADVKDVLRELTKTDTDAIKNSLSNTTFTDVKDMEIVEDKYRRINIKAEKEKNISGNATMMANISLEDKMPEVETSVEEENTVSENTTIENEIQYQEVETKEENNTAPVVDTTLNVSKEDSNINTVINTETPVAEEVKNEPEMAININEYIAKLSDETGKVKDIQKAAKDAQELARVSTEDLNKISVEVSELEKSEEAARKRNLELERQIVLAYQSQNDTLVNARQEYEKLIEEANLTRQENENKIVEFKNKGDQIRSNITSVNESIAKKQAILSAIQEARNYVNNEEKENDNSEKSLRLAA